MEKRKSTQGTQGGAPAPAPESIAQEPTLKERVENTLRAYPSLEAGYICKAGVYFDQAIAESFLEEGEKLIVVPSPIQK